MCNCTSFKKLEKHNLRYESQTLKQPSSNFYLLNLFLIIYVLSFLNILQRKDKILINAFFQMFKITLIYNFKLMSVKAKRETCCSNLKYLTCYLLALIILLLSSDHWLYMSRINRITNKM